MIRILGIARDGGKNHVASFVRCDSVRRSSTQIPSSLIVNNDRVKKCSAQAGLPGSLKQCAETLAYEDVIVQTV